jgi:hypothetical protein
MLVTWICQQQVAQGASASPQLTLTHIAQLNSTNHRANKQQKETHFLIAWNKSHLAKNFITKIVLLDVSQIRYHAKDLWQNFYVNNDDLFTCVSAAQVNTMHKAVIHKCIPVMDVISLTWRAFNLSKISNEHSTEIYNERASYIPLPTLCKLDKKKLSRDAAFQLNLMMNEWNC